MPAAVLAPVMYYAGRGAAGVPIINASLATSIDLGGNARGCLISDVLTPGKPQLYLTVHTKYYFRWDTGVRTVTGVTPTVADACSCATNPANPKVACSASSVATCNYVTHNVDRGVFQVVAPNGDQLSSLPTTISAYAGLPGISADSRVNPDKMLTSQMNYERYCNFYLAAPDLMYISDAAYNSNNAQNWYVAQTNKLNWVSPQTPHLAARAQTRQGTLKATCAARRPDPTPAPALPYRRPASTATRRRTASGRSRPRRRARAT